MKAVHQPSGAASECFVKIYGCDAGKQRPATSRTGSKRARRCSSRRRNNTLAQFSASPDLHKEFLSAVIGAMDASEDLSAQIINNPDLSQKLLDELVPIIYNGLKATA